MAFRLLLTAILALLLSAGSSHAEPVSAIVTFIGSILAKGGLAAALLKGAFVVASNVGLGLIQQARAKKAQRKQDARGTTLSVQFGDTLPLSYILGTRATAGRRYYAGTWGSAGKTPNAFATDCRVISSLPSNAGPQGLDEAWFGETKGTILWDQPHPDGRGYPVKEFRGTSGKDYLWVKYYDGSQTTADAFLLEKFGAVEDHPYKATMIGRGCQLVIYTCRVTEVFFPNGFPDGLFVPRPMKLYDLRRDSTAGGSGPQRWNNPSTWESSNLLPVMMYNVARGIYFDGNWVHGGRNFAAHRLPASSWMAAINEADREMAAGRKQYRGGLEVFVDEEPLDTLEDMRIGCAGHLADVGGALKLQVGSPAGAVYAITDANVVVTSDQDFEPFPSITATHNTITADYPEPKERWAYKDAPKRTSSALVARDGGQELPVHVRFEAVFSSGQVQSLEKAMLAEEQRWRVHQFSLPPTAKALEPNDVMSWTSEKQSYSTKRFHVKRVDHLGAGLVRVLMREMDPNDYDPPEIIIDPVVGWIGPIIVPPQPMPDDFMVEPFTVKDASGRDRRPGIKVKCPADLDDVRNIRVTVRLKSSGAEVFKSDATPYVDPFEWVISGQWTLPATQYQVSGLLIPFSNRPTEPSAWKDVTTPNIQLIADDILDGAIVAGKIADAAVTASKIMDEAVTNLKLAEAAVSTSKIQVGAVVTESIGLGAVIGSRIADAAVTGAKMAAATIDATKFASGIQPVGIIPGTTVPTTKATDVITVNGKLYRWNGTAYVVDVASSDITGQIIGNQIADLAITNPKLAAAAVDAAKLANNAVTNTKIADDAISTPKLQANSVVASVIAADAVTAKHMVLTDSANLVQNGSFQQGLDGWLRFEGAPTVEYVGGGPESRAVRLIKTGAPNITLSYGADFGNANAEIYGIPVQAGEVMYVECWVYSNVAGGINPYGLFGRRKDTGALIEYGYGSVALAANVWTKVSSNIAITVDGYLCPILINNLSISTVYITAFKVMRRNAAKLIVDGSIITNMLQAGAITADKLGANSVIAGKVAAGAISTAELAAGAVITSKLAAGSVVADKLAIGTSNNLIPNADFSAGTTNWAIFVSGGTWPALLIRNDQFAIPTGSLQVFQGDPQDNDKYADVHVRNPQNTDLLKFSVTAGSKYEISFYAYGHRSNYTRMHVGWYNAAGTVFAYDWCDVSTHQNLDPQKSLANYTRGFSFPVAPAGAVFASIFFRVWGNSAAFGGNSYTWIAQPYFGAAQPNQTEPSVWSSGITTLIGDGNVITGSIHANKLVALSITSAEIAAGAITAGKIQAGSVTATEMAASTITGAKIAANTIGATNIAAQTITAKHLVLTDFNNLVPDNQMMDGSGNTWTVNGNWGQYPDHALFTSYNAWFFHTGWGSGGYIAAYGTSFPVKGAAPYRLVGQTYSNNNYNSIVRVTWLDAGGAFITYHDVVNTGARVAGGVTGNLAVVAPSNAVTARVELYVNRDSTAGPVYFGGIGVFERNGAELIVDGGIIANHLSANSVTAAAIAANSINAGHLQAGSITTDKLQAGSITTDKLILGGVTVDKIAPGAVSAAFSDTLAAGAWSGGNRDLSITVAHGTGSPTVLLFGTGGATAHPTDGDKTITFSMRTTGQINAIAEDVAQGKKGSGTIIAVHTPGSGTSSTTYTFRMAAGTMSSADLMTMMVQVLKR